MRTILDTVVDYEDQILVLVKKAKSPVVDYVAKGVDLVGDRLPAVSYPTAFPTPIEVVETQVIFAKKLIDANAAILTAVLKTTAPVAGYSTTSRKPVVKAAKAA